MNSRLLPVILALLCSAGAIPADADTQEARNTLEKQRAQYRQTVALYGTQSAQARDAKRNLRVVRRQYFDERRRQVHASHR